MPMNGDSWGTKIANDLLSANPDSSKLSADERTQVEAAWKTICGDNVSHISTNALVTSVGPDPQGGVVNSTGTVT